MELDAADVPPPFEESNVHLDAAVTYMLNRIAATIAGIEVMWDTGKVSSANTFFSTGRTERDRYRAAMEDYHEALPFE
jgi:hypothetical protein